jgi:hypothetical protein
MSITITGPKEVTLPSALGGNDQIYGLVLVAVTRGIVVEDFGEGQVRLRGLTDRSLITVDIVKLLVSVGCEVEGYLTYFEIDDLDAEVPAEFPNRTFTEFADPDDPESGVEKVHTWATWGQREGGSEWLYQRNGKHYRSSNNRLHAGNPGQPINASNWVSATLTAGLVVVDAVPNESE